MSDQPTQPALLQPPAATPTGPVTCLGLTFASDAERRAHFTVLLAEKLKDPAFRQIEGFPIGTDEDILALSDPPYYTACPNPWISAFIQHYSEPYAPNERYDCEPFADDVSEGKSDPVYNAHAYPTKVPPGAIEPLVEHYCGERKTVILDPFAGTGMTGIAAGRATPAALAVLLDISPAAAHIAASMQGNFREDEFHNFANQILRQVEDGCAWMYSTQINGTQHEVRYFVWSDVYACDYCGKPVRIWDIEGGKSIGGLKEEVPCPHCDASISKQSMKPIVETYYDFVLDKIGERIKSTPVLKVINLGNRSLKLPVDDVDVALLGQINNQSIPFAVPTAKMLFKDGSWGDQWRSSYHHGVTHSHHFYTHRNLWILSAIWDRIRQIDDYAIRRHLQFWFTASLSRMTKLNRYMTQHNRHVGPLAGTLFLGPIQAEISPFYFFREKITDITSAFLALGQNAARHQLVSVASSTTLRLPENSIDFIFTDPPFGDNLMYSELNFLMESWLGVFTNQGHEAVIAVSQSKGLREFEACMRRVFSECYSALKPGRWAVVEFHNSRNIVWAAIQEALSSAGLVIADVRTLDKQKGTTKQLTQAGTVKQDLIITAYKPNVDVSESAELTNSFVDSVWSFVRMHLEHLPTFFVKDGQGEIIAERRDYLIFDRMVAFHVQRGIPVPMSAGDFYRGLAQRFPERDGMYFLPEQAAEYDRKRMSVKQVLQLSLIITDESSAIQWLKQQLTQKPQTFQELHPQFIREIGGWQKHERSLELSALLEQNFLRYDGKDPVPSQVHSYLSSNYKDLRNLAKDDPALRAAGKDRWYVPDPNKAADLEQLRERGLLREFDDYRASTQRKIKVFRLEAVRAGFKRAWQARDYATIIAVAEKIPEDVLQEDPKLLMWYDQALTRSGVN